MADLRSTRVFGELTVMHNATVQGNLTVAGILEVASVTGKASSADVLATARTLKIGNSSKTFNGSANVTWTLAEIGAAAATTSIVAGTGLTGGGTLASNRTLNVTYGTAASTAAQGNDSRINNGQTAFGWGNHASAGYVKTNTTYTAGAGLTLSGTAFSLPITVSGSGTYISNVVQTATGITITKATPPNSNTTYAEITSSEVTAGTSATLRTITGRRLKEAVLAHGLSIGATASTAKAGDWTPAVADIPNLPASKITSGVLSAARIPTLNQSTTGSARTLEFVDTRAVNDLPSDIPAQSMSLAFKSNSAVNDPPVVSNNSYSHIMSLHGWNGSSGGLPSQLSFGDGLAIRAATSLSAWGPWRDIWHDGNLDPADASRLTKGTIPAARIPTLNQSTTGNAGTATTLRTSRTLTIGSTGKTFNGSANVAWTLAEIGAASVNDSRINNGQTAYGWGNHASAGYVTTNTTYTAGAGLTLSGTAFSLPVTLSGSGTYVRSVAQTASGITVTLGTPPNTNTTYAEITAAEVTAGTAATLRSISGRRIKQAVDDHGLKIGTTATTARAGNWMPTAAQVGAAAASHTHSNISITAGTGLSGGGTLAATRTLSVEAAQLPSIATSLGTLDLDTVQTPGFYYQSANANATAARNYPTEDGGQAGALVVTTAAGVVQEYTTYGSNNRKFTRGFYGSTWSAWKEVLSSSSSIDLAQIPVLPGSKVTGGSTSQFLRGDGTWQVPPATVPSNMMTTNTAQTITSAKTFGGWLRTTGAVGWLSTTYGGGIMMQDTTWVRIHGSKALMVSNQIAATGNITAYYSDVRLKENIKPIESPLAKISKLNGVTYNANALGASFGYDRSKSEIGLLAHEVEAVIPQAVEIAPFDLGDEIGKSKSGENYLTLKYERIVPLLLEGIKELSSEVDALKSENQDLKSRLERLEALILS